MIFLDMDGVLCDFVGAALRVHGRQDLEPGDWEESMYEALGLSPEEFWAEIDAHGDKFWMGLEPYPWTRDLAGLAQAFGPISIATSPSLSPESAAGKVAWLQRFFGSEFRDYMIGSSKSLLAKAGAILIDDTGRQCDEFESAGGEAILFPQPWNANRGLCDDRLGYVRSQLRLRMPWVNDDGGAARPPQYAFGPPEWRPQEGRTVPSWVLLRG